MPELTTQMIGEKPPKLEHAEGAKKRLEGKPAYQLKKEKGTALHPDESEEEAFHRIHKLIFNVALPARQQYDAKIREIKEAYQGVIQDAKTNDQGVKVFPLVFMVTDAKLSVVMANRPRAVFEHDTERQKIPMIEAAYETFTTDADRGADLDTVDYKWHWYNELYGWAVKRIWAETESCVSYEPTVVRDENDQIVYDTDGYAKIENKPKLYSHLRVRHRVYEPDMVVVDPAGDTLASCRYIAFIEDIYYNEAEQTYAHNPLFKEKWQFVEPGKLAPHPDLVSGPMVEGQDSSGTPALVYGGTIPLLPDRVRKFEVYDIDRDEYYFSLNNVPMLHVPNPCPPDPESGKKPLPAADLHNRLRPGSFYSMGEGELAEVILTEYQKLLRAKVKRAQLAASPVVLTDTHSSLSPKSFKVVPGAHFRGMKGRIEVLNLAGTDTGEVSNELEELRNQLKTTSGVDYDRFIAEPDPTALQQAARDAQTALRTKKDISRYEASHVRSMDITVMNIQFWMTIPEIKDMADVSDEEREAIPEYDKVPAEKDGRQFFRRYQKIRTKGKVWKEVYEGETLNLVPDKSAEKDSDGTLNARPEFLRTKTKVKVRAVSDRKQIANRQIRYEVSSKLLETAFALPPKNQFEIDAALAGGKQPPKPEDRINKQKAVERFIDAVGEDVKEMTAPEDRQDLSNRPATKAIMEMMKVPQKLAPDPEELAQQQTQQPSFSVKNFQPQGALPSKPNVPAA